MKIKIPQEIYDTLKDISPQIKIKNQLDVPRIQQALKSLLKTLTETAMEVSSINTRMLLGIDYERRRSQQTQDYKPEELIKIQKKKLIN